MSVKYLSFTLRGVLHYLCVSASSPPTCFQRCPPTQGQPHLYTSEIPYTYKHRIIVCTYSTTTITFHAVGLLEFVGVWVVVF